MDDQKLRTSRLPGFYSLPLAERLHIAAEFSGLSRTDQEAIFQFSSLSQELTDSFIENAVGTFSLPLGIATNFLINGTEVLIPMAIEESSVVAAASHGAKLARCGNGFATSSSAPIMVGQVQIFLPSLAQSSYETILAQHKDALIAFANQNHRSLNKRGGGAKDLSWYPIPEIQSLILKLHINTCDAMGANIVNTMCETLATQMPILFPQCEVGLRILTNLSDQRLARAEVSIPVTAFNTKEAAGRDVAQRIVRAWEFAWHDIYRASTHNKGVMNGIDPVMIATGNDWRAIEAGAHAHCVKEGKYRPMTIWRIGPSGNLDGSIEIPMAVGTVGGVTRLHPTTRAALKLMGNPDARKLAEIACAVGLAQNLSALRALASEGIQQGHMNLHQKNSDLHRQNLI